MAPVLHRGITIVLRPARRGVLVGINQTSYLLNLLTSINSVARRESAVRQRIIGYPDHHLTGIVYY